VKSQDYYGWGLGWHLVGGRGANGIGDLLRCCSALLPLRGCALDYCRQPGPFCDLAGRWGLEQVGRICSGTSTVWRRDGGWRGVEDSSHCRSRLSVRLRVAPSDGCGFFSLFGSRDAVVGIAAMCW
jgi:hypothetical protein